MSGSRTSASLLAYINEIKKSNPNFKTLDLNTSKFKGELQPGFGSLSGSEVAKMQPLCETVEEVNLSGHSELTGFAFSRFYKLPSVKKIYLHNIEPQALLRNNGFSVESLIKCLAKGIWIYADPKAEQYFIDCIVNSCFPYSSQADKANFVRKHGLRPEGEALEKSKALFDELHEAVDRDYVEKKKLVAEQKMIARFLSDCASGSGFDTHSEFYKNGPKKAEDFIIFDVTPCNQNKNKECFILYMLITQLNLWPAVAQNRGYRSFMYSSNQNLDGLFQHPIVKALRLDSLEMQLCMELMRDIAKKGSFNNLAQEYQQARLSNQAGQK